MSPLLSTVTAITESVHLYVLLSYNINKLGLHHAVFTKW